MSTVSTQLNWGTSYLVNDFYARFVKPAASEQHLVGVSRVITVGVMLASAAVTFSLDSVRQAWEFILESGAGIGLVFILRWYWWRVTAVSEISALIAAAIGFLFVRGFTTLTFPTTLLYLVPWTTVCWLFVTWLTPPEPLPHLVAFYKRIRPGGVGWRYVATAANEPPPKGIVRLLGSWGAGCFVIYGTLFGVSTLMFGSLTFGLFTIMSVLLVAAWLYRDLAQLNF